MNKLIINLIWNKKPFFLIGVPVLIFIAATAFIKPSQEDIPICFEEYMVEISSIAKLGDTILYNRSSIEDFKFIFYDRMGKCYCERYLNGKLSEKGNYENSLDTLKKYVSGRWSDGTTSPVRVVKYFMPLRNGEWLFYKNGKVYLKEHYVLGRLKRDK